MQYNAHKLTYHRPTRKFLHRTRVFVILFFLSVKGFTSPQSQPANLLSPDMLQQIKSMPYDDMVFKTAFQSLVYNSHIQDAYQLALIAVANRPQDLSWHEKLAQTAIWVGDYNTGFKEWLYVEKENHNIETIKYVISIAKIQGFDQVLVTSLRLFLEQNPNDVNAQIDLANALNRLGKPQKALAVLSKIPTKEAKETVAQIYMDLGQWDNALSAWQSLDKHYGPTIKSVMTEGLIHYSRSQFAAAVNILKLGIPIAKSEDTEFWQTLGDLAWLINDTSTIAVSYSHVLNSSSNLIRLIGLEMERNPQKALNYSLLGWQRYKNDFYLNSILFSGLKLNQWQTLNTVLMNLPEKQLQHLSQNKLFWEVQAAYYAYMGAQESQRKVLIQGLKLHPQMLNLESSLLWSLITNGETLWIKTVMEDIFQRNLMNNEELWHPFAEGFNVLNLYFPALVMYQQHLLTAEQQEQILIDYAALLERAQLYQEAQKMRALIWQRSLAKLEARSKERNRELVQSLAQIAPFFVSGTEQAMLFNALMAASPTNDDVNIFLNWLAPRHYDELITYVQWTYLHGSLPDWAGINLALNKNDLPSLQAIMAHSEKEWPRADRINAAVRLENKPLAVSLAFQELTERPQAPDIYSEFTQYGLELANHCSIGEEYEQFINVIGPRTKVESKLRLTNSLRITPSFSLWRIRSNQAEQITNVPNYDTHANVSLEQTIHRGTIRYNLGYRNALSSFIPASMELNYTLAGNWQGNFKIYYNQEDLQNSYLRIGGVQDQLNLSVLHHLSKRDLWSLELQGLNYYSQNRHYLANGFNVLGLYQHKFWLSYPDYTIGVFANSYNFYRNGSFGGNVTTLFPALTPEQLANPALAASAIKSNYQQLIPNSYNEGGLIFSFGEGVQEYSHIFRPFLWASVYYNTITALSNNIRAGVNGTILGRDSLLIYVERGSAAATTNAINYMIGARYMIFFS
ncbi:tetratricopeptide repeat protein [Legionella rowbothamii]|uniref:tetratricopeptide repeat protein n=1 Tax=Legionella rowbothamii TaxID=96229 RepID=UPI0010550C75|nr:tetratricopeptide repeat protein [Legionella rowbothamii]